MKSMLLVSTFVLSTAVFAAPTPETFTVETYEVSASKLSSSAFLTEANNRGSALPGGDPAGVGGGVTGGIAGGPETPVPRPTMGDRVDQAGKVIQAGREMVALGEAIYELVKKGKPSNTTDYAPISVVPRDPMTKEYADPFELEGFSMPVERNYVTKIKNGMGSEVVSFSYKVVYAYGGSFNGTGKYLTSVMIVPASVKTTFGWDFSATMKLGGIMNNGTKADPVAGVIINIKYQMNSWSAAFERTDSVYINGRGELKNMNVK